MSELPSYMPSDETIRAATLLWFQSGYNPNGSGEDLSPIRALIREAVRAHDSERFGQYLLDMRGIDGEPCRECGGVGVKAYGDTSTWRGGVGGQMITNAVCDRCWGSGDPDRPWVNLRTLKSDQEQAIRAAVEKALAEQEARHRREVLQAKIDTLDDLWHATKRDHSGKAVEVAFASHVTPSFIREEVDRLAAELAALDKEVK